MLDWFPDRRGLASGLVIAGFGSGALAFTPLVQNLCVVKYPPSSYQSSVNMYKHSLGWMKPHQLNRQQIAL